jgi:transmembrane sensor
MERQGRTKLNTQIYEEATAWFIDCRSGDLDEAARGEFDHWLRKSPENLSAYLEIAAIWNEGASLDPKNKWDANTLISQAAQDRDNVVVLPNAVLGAIAAQAESAPKSDGRAGQGRKTLRWVGTGGTRWRRHAIASSFAVLSLGVGLIAWVHVFGAPTYATATGEQRSIQLEDGSTVELNSRSKVAVRYSEHERAIELLEGQALFHVTKDAARPFVVRSGDTRVRAVGTQFDVYRKHGGTIVTVVEGRVAILTDHPVADADVTAKGVSTESSPSMPPLRATQGEGQGPNILLSAGEQLTVTPKMAQKTEHANVAGATAWTERQLIFESASLSDVAEEFNRYNRRQLIIDDPRLETFHISGVFSSTDPVSLIRFLRERPGLSVVETPSEIRIVRNIS